MKLHHFIFSLLASFAKPSRNKADLEAIKQEESLAAMWRDRRQIKLAAIKEWSKPENVALRRAKEAEEAPKALARAQEMAKKINEEFNIPEDMPFPENVPPHMKGQARSTILAMLRQEAYEYDREFKIWKKKDCGVVQLAERVTVNDQVAGSSPAPTATNKGNHV